MLGGETYGGGAASDGSVIQRDDTVGNPDRLCAMRDDDNRTSFFGPLPQHREDQLFGYAVELSGRFICQEDGRRVGQSDGQTGPGQFTTGQLPGQSMSSLSEPYLSEQFGRRDGGPTPAGPLRQPDVVPHTQVRQ
ncbi:hypothetical protein ADL25_03500 [Streptomyces sp. NRRL F-5122]|nr:hypothetical protein ADL25_03500 [Streptomyces sp. NRRL F-5122]